MLEHLGQIAQNAAQKFGDREALIFEDTPYTYNQLNEMVEKVAGGLESIGIEKDNVVTLYASNCWEWVVSYFAIARIGAVINPLNTMLTPSEIEYVANDCGAKAIITSEDKAPSLLPLKSKTDLETIISFGNNIEGCMSFNSLLDSNLSPSPIPSKSPKSLSTIGYTSGTTGHPKGAMQSHEAVILNGSMTSQLHSRGSADVIVSALPCPHVYGNVLMTGMMMFGTKLILHKTFDAEKMLSDIELYKATIFDGVPTMYMLSLIHI